MSEQISNNSEESEALKPRPIFDECPNEECDNGEYQLTALNTKIWTHEKQPNCDFMICTCPKCKKGSFYWIDDYYRDQSRLNGIPDNNERAYAPDDIYQRWLRFNGIELIEEVEITARHEKLVRAFGEVLRTCTDDLLYSFITDENGDRPHPTRWC